MTATFAYNPASQIASAVRTGDLVVHPEQRRRRRRRAWTGHFDLNVGSTVNGLNQIANFGTKAVGHDSKGNITAFGSDAFTYSSENLLKTGPGATTLSYDPMMRLYQTVSGATTMRLAYDGLDRIAEYNATNVLQRRYVHGPAMDEQLVWYEGATAANRRFLSADERGSIISVTDSAGAVLGLNRYDEYGQPQATNLGTFGYTGQAWLPSVGVWYYKARVYEPELGRFLQTDPIGYWDSMNLYAYVGNDPINLVDPFGLAPVDPATGDIVVTAIREIVVTARRGRQLWFWDIGATANRIASFFGGGSRGGASDGSPQETSNCTTSVNGTPSPLDAARSTRTAVITRSLLGALNGISGALAGYASVAGERAYQLYPGNSWDPRNAAAGNRLYGAVTNALGLPRELSLRMSGFVEQYGSSSNSSYDPANGTFLDRSGNLGNSDAAIQNIDEGSACAQ